MTLQPEIPRSIQERKACARKYSRHAILWSVGSIAVGLMLGVVASWWLFLFSILLGGVMLLVNVNKVNKIINHQDEWS